MLRCLYRSLCVSSAWLPLLEDCSVDDGPPEPPPFDCLIKQAVSVFFAHSGHRGCVSKKEPWSRLGSKSLFLNTVLIVLLSASLLHSYSNIRALLTGKHLGSYPLCHHFLTTLPGLTCLRLVCWLCPSCLSWLVVCCLPWM